MEFFFFTCVYVLSFHELRIVRKWMWNKQTKKKHRWNQDSSAANFWANNFFLVDGQQRKKSTKDLTACQTSSISFISFSLQNVETGSLGYTHGSIPRRLFSLLCNYSPLIIASKLSFSMWRIANETPTVRVVRARKRLKFFQNCCWATWSGRGCGPCIPGNIFLWASNLFLERCWF